MTFIKEIKSIQLILQFVALVMKLMMEVKISIIVMIAKNTIAKEIKRLMKS